ncbi:MAG: cytochrome c oxidase subunit II [Rickettsiales bacterium]|nr:cytochrome c oxidase subunit II [Rickettsiales bacterium]
MAPAAMAEVIGMAKPKQLSFQEPASPVMEQFINLHDYILVIITVITLFVVALLAYTCVRFSAKRNPTPSKTSHNTLIEIIWTAVPVVILVAIAIPSLRVHYNYVYDYPEPDVTLKVVGYQWYWNYEYPDEGIIFDSNMKTDDMLEEGEPRLLAVDNPIVVPVNKNVRVQVTGGDVLHAFAIPAFGVKKDTVPGRLNETWFKATKEGTFYGQCSELCGIRHGFMPIQVEVVSEEEYAAWLEEAKEKFAKDDFGTSRYASAE